MQEIIEGQYKVQSKNNFSQMISFQYLKKKLLCKDNNQGYLVCISPKCQQYSIICQNTKCICNKSHQKCSFTKLPKFLAKIQEKFKERSKDVQNYYKQIKQKLDKFIEQLSLLKQKFQREQEFYGFSQEQIQLITLVNQRKMEKLNGKFMNYYQKTFDDQILQALPSNQYNKKRMQIKQIQFNKLLKQVQSFLIEKERFYPLLKDSKIVQSSNNKQLLNKWLCQTFDDPKRLFKSKLLFRASQNYFSSQQFHKYCDNIQDTLVIIKNEHGKIFGGFTSALWTSSEQDQQRPTDELYVQDFNQNSFIFSLDLSEKYQCIIKQQSIWSNMSYGPCFGDQDITILNKCNQYNNSSGAIEKSYNTKQNNDKKKAYESLFGGQFNQKINKQFYDFSIKQYQVFQIKRY